MSRLSSKPEDTASAKAVIRLEKELELLSIRVIALGVKLSDTKTELETETSSVKSDATALTTRVTTLEGDVTALTTRVTASEDAINALDVRVTALEA